MNPGGPDLFGQPLGPDPQIALQPIELDAPLKTGPLHKVQFVIEFVGQRTVLAGNAAQLLAPDWYNALGQPNILAMRPADLQWQPLTPSLDGSYDSLAMTWDLLTSQGTLSSASAAHLLALAERFAPYIQRRAVAMPLPSEVDAAAKNLKRAKDILDIGFQISVLSSTAAFLERDLWIVCSNLGLEYSPEGSFDWRTSEHVCPLLSVTPIGQTDAFALRNVEKGMTHVGVTIGFSLPLNPAPVQSIDACLYVGQTIANRLGGYVLDDSDRPITEKVKADLKQNLREGLSLFSRTGMTTGCAELLRLFG